MSFDVEHPLDKALRLSKAGEFDAAERILRSLPQDDLRVQFNLGWFDLTRGDFQKGFDGLNMGRFIEVFGSKPIPGLIWRNEPLQGKTLLLRMEGGLGDEIINFRFASHFRDKGATVVICCSASLAPLFSSHGFVCVTEPALGYVHYDFWVPAMSSPYVLGHDYSTLPGGAYINRVEPRGERDGRLRVGLRWGGNIDQKDLEPTRKIVAADLIDCARGLDVQLVSFQRDADLVGVPFEDLRDSLATWDDTRAWLCGLDLLITSCTSVAHMAAAMGIQTWILVPILPYYTWAIPGPKTAWYQSTTLFRQTTAGSWKEPLSKITIELKNVQRSCCAGD